MTRETTGDYRKVMEEDEEDKVSYIRRQKGPVSSRTHSPTLTPAYSQYGSDSDSEWSDEDENQSSDTDKPGTEGPRRLLVGEVKVESRQKAAERQKRKEIYTRGNRCQRMEQVNKMRNHCRAGKKIEELKSQTRGRVRTRSQTRGRMRARSQTGLPRRS